MRNPRHTLPVVRDHEGDGARTASRVRDYYEGNTRLFLSLGIGGKTLAMRRAVWAAGVQDLSQAVDHVNRLIAAEIRSRGAGGGAPLRVLDVGCGVGGSLVFLCGALGGAMQGVGVTISPRQADIARRQARLRGLARQLSFLAADFATVGGLPTFHCAFAIESFVHFAAPGVFFAAAARSLEPGGRLVVVDDFLSRERFSARESRLVRAFQEGWILSSLCTVGRAADTAAAYGLRLVEDRNLSPGLSPLPLSAPVIASLSLLARALPVPWSYWRSTAGSLALAACQKARLVEYHYLVFEKGDG
jgi:SAM-dependent methyltransferase